MPRNLLVGRLTMHRDGFGFVIPEATSLDASLKARLAGDVFIPPHATGSSMHGDRVLVEVSAVRTDGRAEGRIVRSLSRAHPTVVGIFHYGHRHNYVKPIDEKVTQEIVIPPGMEIPNVAPPSSVAPAGTSQRVIDLKQRRHELSEELHALRIQREMAMELLSNLNHRIDAATDLLRLKTTGVG